jgi:mono/diheme cytochrome c family protein
VSANASGDTRHETSDTRRLVSRVSCLIVCLSLSACSWFTDFKQQPKIDPWETPNDTIPFRGNPQMSVPIYGTAAPGFQYPETPMGLASNSPYNAIQNPVAADSASINRGRVNFQINCAVCHGPQGMGNGPATKYGMAMIGIGLGSNATNYADGYIFGMIRNGRGFMPSYNRIEEHDRWDIINYLRTLQGKNTAIAADTTHCRPGETGSCVPAATTMGPTRPSPFYRANAAAAGAGAMPSGPATPASVPAPGADTSKKATTDTTKKPEQRP